MSTLVDVAAAGGLVMTGAVLAGAVAVRRPSPLDSPPQRWLDGAAATAGGAGGLVSIGHVAEVGWTALDRHPDVQQQLGQWLAVTDRSWEDLVVQLVRWVGAGAVVGLSVAIWAALGHLDVITCVAVVVAACGAAATGPLLSLRRQVAHARAAAEQAVSVYADLVVLCLAGGMGIESALAAAAVAGDPLTTRIARTLDVAGGAGRSPWDALAELGEALGVSALVDLAVAVGLAGTEGSAVRATLAARAETLRRRRAAADEARANAVTERLFVPSVLLLIGFLLFIGYPAVARILTGL